jgi:hypothetical protein
LSLIHSPPPGNNPPCQQFYYSSMVWILKGTGSWDEYFSRPL